MDENIIDLYLQILNLKKEVRRGWKEAGVAKPESVADHSFGTAVLAILLNNHTLDTNKLVALAVVHDLLECITGDIIWETGKVQDINKKQMKKDAEAKALATIQSYVSKNHYLLKLIREYSEQQTAEAKYVKLLDKLEMALQALSYTQENDNLQEFFTSANNYLKGTSLQTFFTKIVERTN